MAALPSTFRRRSFFALGAVTFSLGLAAHWKGLSPIVARPLLFRFQSTLSSPWSFSLGGSNSTMAHLKAPQPPPKWDHSAAEILALTKEAIRKDKSVLLHCLVTVPLLTLHEYREVNDRVASLGSKDCNFTSVFVSSPSLPFTAS